MQNEIKKTFLGEGVSQKEMKLRPQLGTFKVNLRGINTLRSPKTITNSKVKSKKSFLGKDIRQKDIKLGPHRQGGSFK